MHYCNCAVLDVVNKYAAVEACIRLLHFFQTFDVGVESNYDGIKAPLQVGWLAWLAKYGSVFITKLIHARYNHFRGQRTLNVTHNVHSLMIYIYIYIYIVFSLLYSRYETSLQIYFGFPFLQDWPALEKISPDP